MPGSSQGKLKFHEALLSSLHGQVSFSQFGSLFAGILLDWDCGIPNPESMAVGAGKEGGIGAVPMNLRDLSIPLGMIRMDTPLELPFFQKLPISTALGFLLRQKESLGQTCAELCVGCADPEVIPVPLEQL